MSDDFDAPKRVELCHHGRKIACPECVDEDPAVEYMLRGEVIGLRAKVREQAEEIERLKRRLAVLDEWEQGHEEAHQRAVDDCPHEEKTWTCCATCHCVEIERRRKAEAELAGRPYAESLATAVKRIEELEDAGIAENHAILKLTDVPREGYTLQEEIRAQLEEAQVELAAERDGALALRVELGARDDETFPAFVRRLSIQSETWRNDLAAERERAKRLEQALAGWLATESLPDCRACAVLDAGLPELALRPAAPEAKESDCTCGEQWPCPLHGGPPAAPEPTPSEEKP